MILGLLLQLNAPSQINEVKCMENNVDTLNSFADLMSQNTNLKPLTNIVEEIMALPEEQLNEDNIEIITGMISGAFTDKILKNAVDSLIASFREDGYSKRNVIDAIDSLKANINAFIEDLHPSELKKRVLNAVFDKFYTVFDLTVEKYHTYDIMLPLSLDEGAQIPTYAHEDDAAADLYAADTVTLSAHSISNMVRTDVHIALPEGWMAMIVPRSSIGAKTGLRLSNSVGIIDSQYRGPLGVLYDNISDSDYTINAGDRIAQLLVFPSYHFKPIQLESLDETERNEGGFGSTGK